MPMNKPMECTSKFSIELEKNGQSIPPLKQSHLLPLQ